MDNGEYPKRNSDFNRALNNAGFKSKRTTKGVEFQGLSLDSEALKSVDNSSIL